MRLLISTLFVAALSLLSTSTAYAWWVAHARVDVTRTRVQATVSNNQGLPIYCRGTVYGRTYYGQVLYANGSAWVNPGRYAYLHVWTDGSNPFVDGWSNIECTTY